MAAAFDEYRANYEAVVEESIAFSGMKHDFFLEAKANLLRELFAERFGDKQPALLDVGCGVGRLHSFLEPVVGHLAGTDISSEAIARAKTEHRDVEYRTMEPGALPWSPGAFDAALAVCVFHHVVPPERPALLAEMTRVVRPGGLVILIEHNPFNPATKLAVLRCPFDHDAILLRAGGSRRLLREGGLREVESRHFLLLPSRKGWVGAIERGLRRVPLGAQYAAFGVRP
jgi:SAM-dependent methyltransferase